jgi:hypothetical protein
MAQLKPKVPAEIKNSEFEMINSNSIYLQGRNSTPLIYKNLIKKCRSAAIHTSF